MLSRYDIVLVAFPFTDGHQCGLHYVCLIKMAPIHPLADGNGRIGRILNAPYLSRHINQHKAEYSPGCSTCLRLSRRPQARPLR